MANIDGAKWRSSRGADWYFQFRYTNTINARTCTTNWELWLTTSSNDTQHVASGCRLYKDNTQIANVAREHHYQNTKLANGTFTTSLDSAGKGSFAIRIESSIYYGTWQTVTATVNITGGWNNISATSITITDNGNNTISFSGTTPANTLNNAVSQCVIYYTTNGTTPSATNGTKIIAATSSNTSFVKTVPISSSGTIKAISYTYATHNTATSNVVSKSVVYYNIPNRVLNLKLNYTGKLTVASTMTFSWSASTYASGYTIELQRQRVVGSIIDSVSVPKPDIGNVTSYTLTEQDKSDLGLNPGDTISASVFAYRMNGQSPAQRIYSNISSSPDYKIENAATLHCKINGVWKNCTPWIKINNVWKPASALYIKVNGAWKQSK